MSEIGTIHVVGTHNSGAAVVLDCIVQAVDGKHRASLLSGKFGGLANDYATFAEAEKALQEQPLRNKVVA